MRLATTDQCEVDLPISTGTISKLERQSSEDQSRLIPAIPPYERLRVVNGHIDSRIVTVTKPEG
jgi:hypothetical protein